MQGGRRALAHIVVHGRVSSWMRVPSPRVALFSLRGCLSSPQPCMRSDCSSGLSLACRSGLMAAMRRRRRGKSSFPPFGKERGREGIALPSRASPYMGKSGRDGEPPPRGAPWETANAWRSARSSPATLSKRVVYAKQQHNIAPTISISKVCTGYFV